MEEESKKEEVKEESNVNVTEETSTNNQEEKKPTFWKKVLNYLITTTNGMAYGLFATLIIGTILGTIASFFPHGEGANGFCAFMYQTINGGAKVLQILTGAGIGVGVALALKMKPLHTVVMAGAGEVAAYFALSTKFVTSGVINTGTFQVGDPLTIYFVVICVALALNYVLQKKTPVDILIVPLFGMVVALIAAMTIRFPAIYVTYAVQWLVNAGTNTVPFLMGIIVAVIMGMALTAPISSAAIGAMIFMLPEGMSVAEALADPTTSGLVIASGAAIVGCCCQMVGFAIQSRKDNSIGMVISIGIGTSMLQFKNILKKPLIWLPTIIASAILGPVSTCWLKLACIGSSAGMGTAGLVGQIGTFTSMGNTWQTWVGIFGLEVIAPALLVWGLDVLFRKLGWIKDGDLKV